MLASLFRRRDYESLERKYASMNMSMSPSMTAPILPVSALVRWSLTMEYGWKT